MPETSILVVGRSDDENQILIRKLNEIRTDFNCTFETAHAQSLPAVFDQQHAVIILNLSEWSDQDFGTINEVRLFGYAGPILVVAKMNVKKVRWVAENPDSNLVFVEKPFDQKDLVGIIRKLLSARAVAQRIHRRFATVQDAEVEIPERAERLLSSVLNLSKGGAYIEFMADAGVSVGDIVKVKMELAQMNRTYTMAAKVVWADHGDQGMGTKIGVEFLGPAEIQRAI